MKVSQKGFSLIEALIALLVLSIGLIGMAGMQTRALIGAQQSYLDSVATLAAVDAQERLWVKLAEQQRGEGVSGDCENIANEVKDNSAYLETPWQENWFDASGSPLSNFTGTISVEDAIECRFSVELKLADDDAEFFIRLPKL